MRLTLAIAVVLLVTGCGATPGETPSTPQPTTMSASTPENPAYPSGATNPAVTQATIGQTICKVGWTATIRPRLPTRSGYEYDHWIPLELGGAPKDPANLWYVPLARARRDDVVENRLHRQVCAHKLSLAVAQAQMAAEKRGLAPTVPPSRSPRPSPARTTAVPSSSAEAYYANCAEARAARVAPLHEGDLGYRPGLDRDHDGIACE